MADNARLVTEDFVSLLDAKVLASHDHQKLSVLAGESYNDILTAIEKQMPSPQQKAAIDMTLSPASAINPVVLVKDIPHYYTQEDMGDIKDTVPTIGNLPPTGNEEGDMRAVLNPPTIWRWDGTQWTLFLTTGTLSHTSLIGNDSSLLPTNPTSKPLNTLNADSSYQHITETIELTLQTQTHYHTFLVTTGTIASGSTTISALASTAGISVLTTTGTVTSGSSTITMLSTAGISTGQLVVGNNIPSGSSVVSVGSASIEMDYVATGSGSESIIFTYLVVGNYIPSGTYAASVGLNNLVMSAAATGSGTETIYLSQKNILDAVTSSGSGIIITDDERSRIPTVDEKKAFQGDITWPPPVTPSSAYPPTGINRFVTNVDPRLNTVTNPYITVGQPVIAPELGALFVGNDIRPFQQAFTLAASGKIRAIEVFPATYPISDPILGGQSKPYPMNAGDVVNGNPLNPILDPLVWSETETPVATPPLPWTIPTTVASIASFHGSFTPSLGYPTIAQYPDLASGYYFAADSIGTVDSVIYHPCAWAVYDGSSWIKVDNTGRNGGLLFECITPGGATLLFQSGQDAIQLFGNQPVTIRGFVIDLDVINTNGILANCPVLIENCTFTTTATSQHVAIRLNHAGSTVRNCIFENTFENAIIVTGNNCTVTDCKFNLANSSLSALHVVDGVDSFIAANNVFSVGGVTIGEASDVQFTKNWFTVNAPMTDGGVNTRWLMNQTLEFGQPFIGGCKSVGPLGSYADYRGNTDAVFAAALSDPYATEISVLESPAGGYVFSSTVLVGTGKSIRSANRSESLNMIYTNGVPAFELSPDTVLDGFSFTGTTATSQVRLNGSDRSKILHCTFNPTSGFGILGSGTNSANINECTFTGSNGLGLSTCSGMQIEENFFQANAVSFESAATLIDSSIISNVFGGATAGINIGGHRLVVKENDFKLGAPTKLGTIDSVWQGNYPGVTPPSPWTNPLPQASANNNTGVDWLKIDLARLLEPLPLGGVTNTPFLGGMAFAFSDDVRGAVSSLPIFLTAKIDMARPYSLGLSWTSNAFSGSAEWIATVTFRDQTNLIIGTPQFIKISSLRTQLIVQNEEFTNIQFPVVYGLATQPTHVSVSIGRLAQDPLDTLPSDAYLINAVLILPRD